MLYEPGMCSGCSGNLPPDDTHGLSVTENTLKKPENDSCSRTVPFQGLFHTHRRQMRQPSVSPDFPQLNGPIYQTKAEEAENECEPIFGSRRQSSGVNGFP